MPHKRTPKSKYSPARILRWVFLGITLAAMTITAFLHQQTRGPQRPPGVDALCPFGGLETLFSLLSGGGLVRHTAAGSVVLLIGVLTVTLVSRRSFCGNLCPLGALQGIFGALGQRVMGRRPAVPAALDRVARWLKYVVLVVFTLWTWRAAELVMRPYDPWATWMHLTSPRLLTEFGIGLVVLIVALAGSFVYERFFCKYLCPTGALLSLASKISLLTIRRDSSSCINCGRCDRACPMNIAVSTAERVTSPECISCNECVNICPVADTLRVTAPGGRSLKAVATPIITLLLMVAVVNITMAASSSSWASEGGRGGGHGRGGGSSQSQGQAGELQSSSSGVRGSLSMAQIAETNNVPLNELLAAFGVASADAGRPLSEIKDRYGFRPSEVGAWVEQRATGGGQPAGGEHEKAVP